MGLWQRLRDVDRRIIAGGRSMQLDDAHVQAWWEGLSLADRVAVWEAARSHEPTDPAGVHAWVEILEAKLAQERRWGPVYGSLIVFLLLVAVWAAAMDGVLPSTLPWVAVVVGMGYGRLRVQIRLERRRADLLAFLLEVAHVGRGRDEC